MSEILDDKILLSLTGAAEICGCSPQKIHRAIRRGVLKAEKVGWNWIIKRSDLDEYAHNNKEE